MADKEPKVSQDEKDLAAANKTKQDDTSVGKSDSCKGKRTQITINPTIDEAFSQLHEADNKKVVFGWGRMNPPTSGHGILVDSIKSIASKQGATPAVYLSHSQDPKKNPLSYNDKILLAMKAFGSVVTKSRSKTLIDLMKELNKKYSDVVLVAGADRIKEFETILNRYNGKDYNFNSIEVVSAGSRADPDSDAAKDMSAANMSASVMRRLAAEGKEEEFAKGLPAKLKRDSSSVYSMVREGMKLAEELEENGLLLPEGTLTAIQRRHLYDIRCRYRRRMRKIQKRIVLTIHDKLPDIIDDAEPVSEGCDKRKFHELMTADNKVKHDKRFKRYRNPIQVDEAEGEGPSAVERLKDKHKSEKDQNDEKRENELRSAERREKMDDIRNKEKQDAEKDKERDKKAAEAQREHIEISHDREILDLIESVFQSIVEDGDGSEEGLKNKAKESGMPLDVLKKVYDRGMGAWNSSHKPGATQQQWAMARVNSFIEKKPGTYGKADADLANKVSEEVEIESFFDLNEAVELSEMSMTDKAIAAIHKHVQAGVDISTISHDVSRARGVNKTSAELKKLYIQIYGDPNTRKVNKDKAKKMLNKYGMNRVAKKFNLESSEINESFESLQEEECQIIGKEQIKSFEKMLDKLFDKYDIDFNFTRHFADRMSDERNTPCISLKELAEFMKKIYRKQGKSLKGVEGAEAVIKDMQSDLNIPVVVKYDQANDEFDVVMKTIMRKKNFKTSNKVLEY